MTPAPVPRYRRLQRILPPACGALVVVFGIIVELVLGHSSRGHILIACIIAGCLLGASPFLLRSEPARATTLKLSLLTAVALLGLLAAEAAVRWADYDVARYDSAFNAMPIYFRMPTVPVGGAFFRRPGPAVWRGRVLTEFLSAHGYPDGIYDEQPIVVEYDPLGFRNPPGLTDCEVVVVGDSLVELGHLPYDAISSTIAAKRLGLRVKNLGVSSTSTLTHIFYLRNYARSPSLRHAVLCFYEGNDLVELAREADAVRRYHATGRENRRTMPRQTSLIRAAHGLLGGHRNVPARRRVVSRDVTFASDQGDLPAEAQVAPPSSTPVTDAHRELLGQALSQWADTARELGARPWVLFIPERHRVFHGRLRFKDPADPRAGWTPSTLPDDVKSLCSERGIEFANALPTLRDAVESGRSPYNLVGDAHFNTLGARIMGELIADALSAPAERSAGDAAEGQ